MWFNSRVAQWEQKLMQSGYEIESAGKIILPKWKLIFAGFSLPVSEFTLAQLQMWL